MQSLSLSRGFSRTCQRLTGTAHSLPHRLSTHVQHTPAQRILPQARTITSGSHAAFRSLTRPRVQTCTALESAQQSTAHDILPQPSSLPSISLTQVRGAKRDTYDPSHIVRKRRHGYLSRIKTKNGRKLLKRRQLKGRSTLSH